MRPAAILARLGPAAWAVADQCVVSAANFLTVYVFARTMSAAAFGAFAIAQTALLLLTSMQSALLAQPHNVLGARLEGTRYRSFTTALLLAQAAGSVALCGLLAAAGLLLSASISPRGGSVVLALALAALPWMGQELVRRVLYTRGESRAALANDLLTYGLQLCGAIVLVRALGESARPETALAVLGWSSLAGVAAGAWQLRGHVALRGLERAALRASIAEVWGFGKWLGAQNALAWLGTQGHAWIVAVMLGAEQVGLYRAATHLVNVLNPIRQAAYNYLPARGSLSYRDGGGAGLALWMRKVSRVLALAPLPLCALLVAFPGPLLALAYGDKYASVELALILALSAASQYFTFIKYPFDVGILALGSPRSIFLLYLLPVLMLFTTGVALVHFLGILGVPLSGILINSVLLAATVAAYLRLARGARAAVRTPEVGARALPGKVHG
ncbi:MAG: oligosaccharide flippase family protein [Betaproteobacteria bacterium]|nr:oligosaccharide flippase family protein [Betaproteobacteria bacterium]